MTIRELVQRAFEIATVKGWHETERSPLEYHALIHSEISEATEAVRLPDQIFLTAEQPLNSELVELADAVIRIADYCGTKGWDFPLVWQAGM
jgi:hypothetical protein